MTLWSLQFLCVYRCLKHSKRRFLRWKDDRSQSANWKQPPFNVSSLHRWRAAGLQAQDAEGGGSPWRHRQQGDLPLFSLGSPKQTKKDRFPLFWFWLLFLIRITVNLQNSLKGVLLFDVDKSLDLSWDHPSILRFASGCQPVWNSGLPENRGRSPFCPSLQNGRHFSETTQPGNGRKMGKTANNQATKTYKKI